MEKTCRFYKNQNGEWYIDLPEWEGDISALQMVAGADTLLEIMCEGDGNITVHFSTESFDNANALFLVDEGHDGIRELGGADYLLTHYDGIEYNSNIWLCDVTKFVFGYMPEQIYFKLV